MVLEKTHINVLITDEIYNDISEDAGIKNDFSGKTGWMISLTGFLRVRLAAHVSNGWKFLIHPRPRVSIARWNLKEGGKSLV